MLLVRRSWFITNDGQSKKRRNNYDKFKRIFSRRLFPQTYRWRRNTKLQVDKRVTFLPANLKKSLCKFLIDWWVPIF